MNDVVTILKSTGAILDSSHFVLTSGKHTDLYVNKDFLYPHTAETSKVCLFMAEKSQHLLIDVVVGPALGGIILAQWTASHLSTLKSNEVLAVYTEKTEDNNQQFTRGYDKYVAGKNVLVVEDVTSTGGSAKKSVDAVRAAGGNVVGVTVMVNKNPKEVSGEYFGTEFLPLIDLVAPLYEEFSCPLCESGVPVNTMVGHGKKYLEQKGQKIRAK